MVESALSLGATDFRVIQKILFPIAGSSIATGALFAFVFSMDDVAVTIFLTGTDIYTLPIAMVSNMKSDFNLSIAAASTFIVFMTLVMLFVLEIFVGIDRMVGRGIYRQGAAR
jgi:putative spermidine/putrescine transport system permease protein